MGTYIGKVQIGNTNNLIAVGDTLYGVCSLSAVTADKEVALAEFDRVINGVTVRVKFTHGNTAVANVRLKVGTTAWYPVSGDCTCGAGDIISFTWEEGSNNNSTWIVTSSGLTQSIKDYVRDATANVLGTADAMVFKGTLGPNGTAGATLPPNGYSAGWTYRVITPGQYNLGVNCEEGDLIIAITDAVAGQSLFNASHWTVVQGNLDGIVIGPASSTSAHVATFSGTSGKVIQDSGFTIEKSVPADAIFTDHNTTYTLVKNANAFTGSETSDNEGTVLVTVENGILKLAKGIKFSTTAVGTDLNETTT